MEKTLRSCADQIVEASIRAVLPDEAVRRALKDFHPEGRTVLVAAGKAAWQMAHAAVAVLGHVDGGVVVTKYDHVKGKIPGVTCCEAGHPVPDANSFAATQKALELVQGLQPEDTVLFLLSGGTDTKHFVGLYRSCLRFTALHIDQQQIGSMHAADENVDLETLPRAVDFFRAVLLDDGAQR